MEDLNEKRSLTGLIQGILSATGLAIAVTAATIYILQDYETKSIIKLVVLNLVASHFMLIVIGIIGESFIEDVIKAILISLILIPLWLSDFKNIDLGRENINFVRCIFLSISLGAWYPVVLKILSGLGSDSTSETKYKINKKKDEHQKIIEKSLRRRKRKEEKRKRKKNIPS